MEGEGVCGGRKEGQDIRVTVSGTGEDLRVTGDSGNQAKVCSRVDEEL